MNDSERKSSVLRRAAGGLLVFVGLTGIILSVAGVVACWRVRADLGERVELVGARVDQLLGVTTDSLHQVETVLASARQNVGAVHQAARGTPPPEAAVGGLQKFMLRKLTTEFTPQFEQARRILDATLNGAVVLNSVLKGLEHLPLTEVIPLDTEQLQNMTGELHEATGTVLKLHALVQDLPGGQDSSTEVAQQAAQIQEAIARVEGRVGAFTSRVTQVRDRLTELRRDTPGWLDTVAVLATLFCVWLALGNVCLLTRGWSWLRAVEGGRHCPAETSLRP